MKDLLGGARTVAALRVAAAAVHVGSGRTGAGAETAAGTVRARLHRP